MSRMWNIMKAQNYQIRGDNLVILVLLAGMLLPTGMVIMDFDISELSGGFFMAQLGSNLPICLGMVLVILVSRICGWDAGDKTMNYEVMAGHSRAEVYFGRVITSIIWGLGSGIAMLVIPVLGFTMINGWGDNMNPGDAAVRCVLFLFPMLRLICEFAMLAFLLRDCYKAMLIGWSFFAVSMVGIMIYEGLADTVLTVQLVITNMREIIGFGNYKIEYIGGEDTPVYVTGIDTSLVMGTTLVSLLVAGACLAVGYAVFKKQDMN